MSAVSALQAPIRNESVVTAQVYSHSGEFAPDVVDLEIPARGLSFQFIRKYRSARSRERGPLGLGWTCTYAKRLEQDGEDVLYHDGYGRVHRFGSSPGRRGLSAPDGFYAVLVPGADKVTLQQRWGDRLHFDSPGLGGRLRAIEDRNGNGLQFEYREHLVLVTDPLRRQIQIRLEDERVVELRDHGGRSWRYRYNPDGCLIEVVQPAIQGSPDRPRVRYGYDQDLRLVAITDPNGQTFLRNHYDAQGRIRRQQHGSGTFEFQYEPVAEGTTGHPVYLTRLTAKNGARLDLRHDPAGHVVERTLHVTARALSPDDRNGVGEGTVPLATISKYNRHHEVVERRYPAGNSTAWVYDEENTDPRARGNLLSVTQLPAPREEGGVSSLVTRYTYERRHQQVASLTDPRGHVVRFGYDTRGNLATRTIPRLTIQQITADGQRGRVARTLLRESFKYNEAGQLVRFTDAGGAVAEYFYYRSGDPAGAKSHISSHPVTQRAGGYLARVVRDPKLSGRRLPSPAANVTTGFVYDVFGNVASVRDGRGNATRLEHDAHNRLVRVTARKPFSYTTSYRYDANGNMVEGLLTFDHYEYDPVKQETVLKTTAVRHGFEYDALNNVVRQTLGAGERETVRTFVRDAAENIVREIRPMGNAIEYDFDERNLMIARRPGAGTEEQVEIRHTYTPNGSLRSTTDGRGGTQTYHYDSFHRYQGFTNAAGTVKKQWLDEAGNVTRLQVTGAAPALDARGEPADSPARTLLESWFHYDELNRLVRTDRAWHDPLTGEPLGRSRWDGKVGVASSVVQYGSNLLPSRLWRESGNAITLRHDGLNRLATMADATGETVSIEYDENSNPVRVKRLGPPPVAGHARFHQVLRQEFDVLDRVVGVSLNGENPVRLAYNALGLVTEYKNRAGAFVRYLHDPLGRPAGRVASATAAVAVTGAPSGQALLQRFEWDGNGRLVSWINPRGLAARYRYDALDRLVGLVTPYGATYTVQRDANGNIIRTVDPNRTVITHRFDAVDRLVERRIQGARAGNGQDEKFAYDGLDRLVAAVTGGATTLRRYDSLSRLLSESQSGRELRYTYDSGGNQISVRYPGGQQVHKSYDTLGRVVEVRGNEGLVAAYAYATSTQLLRTQLGEALTVHFTYEPGRDRLNGVVYRSARTGELIDGTKYRYDAAGNVIEEMQLRRGSDFGERYFYDSANRLIRVQYGVEQLSDPNSPFEREVRYELTASGLWRRRTTHGAGGQVIESAEGVADLRDAYVSLGARRFEYDANGNRIREDDEGQEAQYQRRYAYDYANRLVRVERLDATGRVAQTVAAYGYDAFDRQVSKRIADNGHTIEHARVWDGARLVEEMEDGRLARTYVHGNGVTEPLKMSAHASDGVEEFFYLLTGSGHVAGLFGPAAGAVERYRYDAFGLPFLDSANESLHAVSASAIGNSLFAGAQLWDRTTAQYMMGGRSFDARTGQFLSSAWGGYFDFYHTTRVKPLHPDWTALEIIIGIGLVGLGAAVIIGTSLLATAVGAIIMGVGFGLIVDAHFGSPVINTVGEWLQDLGTGGNKAAGPGGTSGNAGAGGSNVVNPGTSGGGTSWGRPSGQPEAREFPEHRGGGSGGSSGGGTEGPKAPSQPSSGELGGGMTPPPSPTPTPATKKEQGPKQEQPKQEPPKPEDKKPVPPGTPIATPNPVDGTGEGIDEDWWRGMPYADALEIVAEMRAGLQIDERHGTPHLRLNNSINTYSVLAVVAPQPIRVDERGETVSINLAGAQSRSTSTGTTTSDGWGDRPRSLAEALAAPRIRVGSISSRF